MPKDQIVFSFTLNGLLLTILAIAGIVAVIFLIRVLVEARKATKVLSDILSRNTEELDATIKTLPGIASKAESTLTEINELLYRNKESIDGAIDDAKNSLHNVSRLTSDASDTFEYVATSLIDGADTLVSGMSSSGKAFGYVKQVTEILRGLLKNRK